jgi:hypothetical protein
MRLGAHRGRAGRIAAAVASAAALGAVAAPPAAAKVWFNDLDGRELVWEQRVASTILGCPGNPSCRETVEGVEVRLRRGPSSRGNITRGHVRRLGRITAQGTIAFRVPRVTAGRYHLVAWMAIGDWHRWMAVSGTFRIRPR